MSTKRPSFRFDAPSGYWYCGPMLLPTRNTVTEVLDRAFVNGEAEIVLGSLDEVDAFSNALIERAESLTGDGRSIMLWGVDDLPECYRLRVSWVPSNNEIARRG
jgi:hypothetical protein